jgi:hypothetical protein
MRMKKTIIAALAVVSAATFIAAASSIGLVKSSAEISPQWVDHGSAITPQWVEYGSA